MCMGRQLVQGTWSLRSSGGFISDWLCSVPRGNTPVSGQSALGDLPECNFHFNFTQKESNSHSRRLLYDGNHSTSHGVNRVMALNAYSSAWLKCDFPVPARQDHAPVQRQHRHAGPAKTAKMSAPPWTWNWPMYTSTWLSVPAPVLLWWQWDCELPQASRASSGALEDYRRTVTRENLALNVLSLVVVRLITFSPSVSP